MDLTLKHGDAVALVCNSNPQLKKEPIEQLIGILKNLGLQVVTSPLLFDTSTRNTTEKAGILQQYFEDPMIRAIFDVSGGDRGNSILSSLDYSVLKKNPTPFFGYSDLSTVLNSLISQTDQSVELFQIKTLIWDKTGGQIKRFKETFFEQKDSLYQTDWEWIQGTSMSGELVGGNLRCFLKLSGTQYQPDLTDKLLFLEALGGEVDAVFSMLHQLKQQPNFSKVKGLLLGEFTTYEKECDYPLTQLVQDVIEDEQLPIIKTSQIGHNITSSALTLGSFFECKK